MTLKAITMNGHHKRFLPTIERFEAVTATLQTMANSAQRASVTTTALRTTRASAIRLAPHFTCSAESCYESENAIKLRIKRRVSQNTSGKRCTNFCIPAFGRDTKSWYSSYRTLIFLQKNQQERTQTKGRGFCLKVLELVNISVRIF